MLILSMNYFSTYSEKQQIFYWTEWVLQVLRIRDYIKKIQTVSLVNIFHIQLRNNHYKPSISSEWMWLHYWRNYFIKTHSLPEIELKSHRNISQNSLSCTLIPDVIHTICTIVKFDKACSGFLICPFKNIII